MLESFVIASLVWLLAGAIISGITLGEGHPEEEWLGLVLYGPISWTLMAAMFLADWINEKVHG